MDKIAFITDLHLLENNVEKKGVNTVENWKTVLKDVTEKGIKKIILGGDLGEKESLEMLFQDVKNFDTQIILGNHDKIKNFKKYELKSEDRDELFYTLKYGGFDFIFLDTSSYKLSKEQQGFLRNWLQEAENPVIFSHHPVLNIGSWMDEKHPLKNRQEVEKIISEMGKNVSLICGHYHQYHEKSSDLITQIIAPAVSYQIPFSKNYQSDTSTFGYLILDFENDQFKYETVIFRK